MQLNNITNNTIVKITKFDTDNNRIKYSINNVDGTEVEIGVYMPTPTIQSYFNQEVKIEEVCYNILSTEALDGTFVLSEIPEDTNWLHPTRNKRLLVYTETILKSLEDKDDFSVIINRLTEENSQATTKFIYRNKQCTVVYINDVSSEDASVVTPLIVSGEIILQEKV